SHAVRTKDGWSLRHHVRWYDGLSLYARPYASFSFHLHHLPTRRRSSIPAKEGGGDPGTSRSVCPMGCSCRTLAVYETTWLGALHEQSDECVVIPLNHSGAQALQFEFAPPGC